MHEPPSDRPKDVLQQLGIPSGPPLHLERPGAIVAHLGPFLTPERLERLRAILGARTRRLAGLLECVKDAHNIAACVRSCDAFGIQDLHIVPEPGATPRLSRFVATGAQRWVTIHRHADTAAAIAALRAAGYRIAATDLGGRTPPLMLDQIELAESPLCLAFGNETDGISTELREECDVRVQIPMTGFVESLNVSVAFAITMHSLRRRLDDLVDAPDDARLTATERSSLLDRWVLEDVKRARAVVTELTRRASQRHP